MLNQRQATVAAIMLVLADNNIEYKLNGPVPVSDVLTSSMKEEIRSILFQQFKNKEVSYREDFQSKVDDDSELKKYISGLVNNWIRKAPEFNSNTKYQAKNPGSRAHVGDAQLKALQALSAQYAQGTEEFNEIAEAIVARKAEIAAKKASPKTIKVDALPEHLRHLVKQS